MSRHGNDYLTRRDTVLAQIEGERRRQDNRWGWDHDSKHSPGEWLAIAVKQLGAVAEAGLSNGNIEREAVQAAAVLVAWMEHMAEGRDRGTYAAL